MKKILGLDLGTNSIGWALIEQDYDNKQGKILGLGSRIIPMSQDVLDNFGGGKPSKTQTSQRTGYRSTRHLRERHLLRRERIHRVLNTLGFLPEHYAKQIDFKNRLGQFHVETEPKLAYTYKEFIFKNAFDEMLEDFRKSQPELLNRKNKKGEEAKVPYDWTIYYLRKKALSEKLEKEELAWLLLHFNQKRGYYQLRGEEEEENSNKLVEFRSLKVIEVKSEIKYNLTLENGETIYRTSNSPLFDWKDTNRNFIVTIYKDNAGKEKHSYFLKDDASLLKNKKTQSNKKRANEIVEEQSIKIVEVQQEKQDKIWYSVVLENGWIYRRESNTNLSEWKDKMRDFIVTSDLNDDGSVKTDEEGKQSRSFRAPKEDDWTLIKKKTESDLEKYIAEYKTTHGTDGTVGTYIYDTLIQKPNQKIRGKLVRTIERKFYKNELKAILKKQIELHTELFSDELYNDCVRELYRYNEAHQINLSKRDFIHLFVDDIIFYQRPLKSKKSSISKCSLEFRKFKSKDNEGQEIERTEYLKAIPKSHPFYQEFRVWQWMLNLKIYKKEDDTEVTKEFIQGILDLESLFDFLMKQKEVNHTDILKYFISPKMKVKFPGAKITALNQEIAKEIAKYRWNFVFDDSKEKEDEKSKKYPCNETGYEIRRRLAKVKNLQENFLTTKIEQHLWHLIYSVTDKIEFETALTSFANKYGLDEGSFVENFKKFKPFESDYGTYSEKAIKKLLPLIRLGKYWDWDNINEKSKIKIGNIINAEDDSEIRLLVREKAKEKKLEAENDFQGLQLWLAQYIVYDRHSEAAFVNQWRKSYDIQEYLYEFKQHSLRNPIVEQVITETLRSVKDIWEHYAEKHNVTYEMEYDLNKKRKVKSYNRFFDEIHIELGRDMKNTSDDRKKLTNQISDNENTNQRIKLLLLELKNDSNIEKVREYSPTQQDILKIYEEYALSNEEKYDGTDEDGKDIFVSEPISEEIIKISRTAQPSKSELIRYKLWLEQRYRSPYTGQMIPLSKLFTDDYEIEHIIPKSRYFDDSMSNKVICESIVNGNPYKDNQLGLEFIKNQGGRIVDELSANGKIVKIFTEDEYRNFVKLHYEKNRGKRTKLLLEDIPEKMIERQLNDTRYISKFVSQVLSNIVRTDDDKAKNIITNAEILANKETDEIKAEEIREKAKSQANDDGVNSKNIVPGNGKITSKLKQEWGLNDVWNELVLPRFVRMNQLKNSTEFTSKNREGHTIPAIPLELSKGFQKKRIDHRHHAMDALIIACATRDHVNLLNNQSAKSDMKRYDLQYKLRNTEKWTDKDGKVKDKFTDFKKPWNTIATDARNALEKTVVSFKQNLRVINKTTNKYQNYKSENGSLRLGKDGKPKKDFISQTIGDSWAIRKSLHTPLPYGEKKYEFQVLDIKENLGKRQYLDDKELLVKVEEVMILFDGKIGEAKNWIKSNPLQDESGNQIHQAIFNIPEIRYRKRQPIMKLANRGQGGIKKYEDAIKFIQKVSDKKIMNELLQHLHENNSDIDLAFSAEGIEKFNQKRKVPVYKLPISEASTDKFPLGMTANTKVKFGEADGGTNLFYAVYWNEEEEKRIFETISFKKAIIHQKSSASLSKENRKIIPENTEKGELLFALSPNDLVYIPTEDEKENINRIDFGNLSEEQVKRIFVVNDFSTTCYFTPNRLAKNIAPKEVDLSFDEKKRKISGSYDTKTASFEGKQIKDTCIKLNVDRLGNIKLATK